MDYRETERGVGLRSRREFSLPWMKPRRAEWLGVGVRGRLGAGRRVIRVQRRTDKVNPACGAAWLTVRLCWREAIAEVFFIYNSSSCCRSTIVVVRSKYRWHTRLKLLSSLMLAVFTR